jgi:citrate lyase beta subunit/hydroxyacyl-ACP dehydratase HTD2-like protein with hotdog domain
MAFPRRMWAGSRVQLVGDYSSEQPLLHRTTIGAVQRKKGRGGELVFLTLQHEFFDGSSLVVSEEQDIVYRTAATSSLPAPMVKPPAEVIAGYERDWCRMVKPAPTLLFRYFAVTSNAHRIHYDRDYCKNTEGYPGLVVHGPLTASLLIDFYQHNNPGKHVRKFAFKGLEPLYDMAAFYLMGNTTKEGANLWAVGPDGSTSMQMNLTADWRLFVGEAREATLEKYVNCTSEGTNLMRSLLFVPGNRPDRYVKASISGADIYCIDLEDAVGIKEKDAARIIALQYIDELEITKEGAPLCYLRINDLTSTHGLKDMLALREMAQDDRLPDCIVLPMASSAFEIRQLTELLGHHSALRIMPLVETPAGINHLKDILDENECVTSIGFGIADYAAAVGSDMSWDALLTVRSQIVAAASERGLHCFDGPQFDILDEVALAHEANKVACLGFKGKMAIHPAQVSIINGSFAPSARDVQWAEAVVKAFEKAEEGVVLLDGRMVDRPLAERAKRILAASAS